MKTTTKIKSIGILIALVSSGGVLANELKVKPGKWKSITNRTNPMTMQPETVEETECLTADRAKISVQKLQEDMKGDGKCEVLKDELKGNTLSMVLKCSNPMGSSKISGSFSAEGEKAKSTMIIEMDIQGQKMKMTMDSKSEWVGECSAND